MRRRLLKGLAAAAVLPSALAHGQTKLDRMVTMVVPYAPGGGLDVLARFVADQLSKSIGQSVIVDNRPGANGAIAANAVTRAKPDGHTLFVGDVGTISINPALYEKLPYDPQRDLTPVTLAVRLPLLAVTSGTGPLDSIARFVDVSRANPGKSTFGSVGAGGIAHLTVELLSHEAGLKLVHVPYRGAPQVLADVASGTVDMTVTSVVSALELVRGGRLRALAAMGAQRAALLPDVPTVSETVMKDFAVSSWVGVYAPAKTPEPVVKTLHAAIAQILQSVDGRERVTKLGFETVASTPAEALAIASADQARWARVIRIANVVHS